ncbi:MAG TPA: hypothetical protein DEF88_15805 [Porphyromonadaceae bacterium]|jgi:hypothetical protein|nr:hypothetical protein [Porphyromonadaceae bacterium]HBX21897.1 hypothetical protein [Porphyromonadaceae bacterium]HCM21334.1 hypothetical protein [Porphyromonadaceae bacterium]
MDGRSGNVGVGKYNYWLNPFVGLTIGGAATYSGIDKYLESPNDPQIVYYIEDKHILNLNCLTGIKLSSPTYKHFGLAADAGFSFEPIPFNSGSVESRNVVTNEEKVKSKTVFTRFNPAYYLQLSLFYRKKTDTHQSCQLAIGMGVTNYNPYNTYYRTTIDGIRLKDHFELSTSKPAYTLFLRLSGLNF